VSGNGNLGPSKDALNRRTISHANRETPSSALGWSEQWRPPSRWEHPYDGHITFETGLLYAATGGPQTQSHYCREHITGRQPSQAVKTNVPLSFVIWTLKVKKFHSHLESGTLEASDILIIETLQIVKEMLVFTLSMYFMVDIL
jgi:hypothetical protein